MADQRGKDRGKPDKVSPDKASQVQEAKEVREAAPLLWRSGEPATPGREWTRAQAWDPGQAWGRGVEEAPVAAGLGPAEVGGKDAGN